MLTAEDALTKTLAKSQKLIFWNQKNGFECFFFLLTAGDALRSLRRVTLLREKGQKLKFVISTFHFLNYKM